MATLSTIQKESTWGAEATKINQNFTNVSLELTKLGMQSKASFGPYKSSSNLPSGASENATAWVSATLTPPFQVWQVQSGKWVNTGFTYTQDIGTGDLATKEDLAAQDEKLAELSSKIAGIGYIECTTAAGTAAKAVTVTGLTALTSGIRLLVKMTYNNTASNATLNINSLGAKPLYYNNVRVSGDNAWESGEVVDVYFDGTNFYAVNVQGGSGASGNLILEWNTDAATTRKQVKQSDRKSLLQISYKNGDGDIVNEQYIGTVFTDTEWVKDNNWEPIPNQKDITELNNDTIEINKLHSDLYISEQVTYTVGAQGASTATETETYIKRDSYYTISNEKGSYGEVTVVYVDGENEQVVHTVHGKPFGTFKAKKSIVTILSKSYQNQPITITAPVLKDKVGDMNMLQTENKNDLVDSINEIMSSMPTTLEQKIVDVENREGDLGSNYTVVDVSIPKGTYYIERANWEGYSYYNVSVEYDNGETEVILSLSNASATIDFGEKTAKYKIVKVYIKSYRVSKYINIYHYQKVIDPSSFEKYLLKNRWKRKKWLLIGDSISTEKNYSGGSWAGIGYGHLVAGYLDMEIMNIAVGGKEYSYFYPLIDEQADDYDLITVLLGSNSQGYHKNIGELIKGDLGSDENYSSLSFYEQSQLFYEKLRKKYPKSVIAYITPIKRTSVEESIPNNEEGYHINALGLTTQAYAEAVKKVCDWYSIPCIDIYNTIDPRTSINRQLYFISSNIDERPEDGTHPNDLGHSLFIAPKVCAEIIKIAPF